MEEEVPAHDGPGSQRLENFCDAANPNKKVPIPTDIVRPSLTCTPSATKLHKQIRHGLFYPLPPVPARHPTWLTNHKKNKKANAPGKKGTPPVGDYPRREGALNVVAGQTLGLRHFHCFPFFFRACARLSWTWSLWVRTQNSSVHSRVQWADSEQQKKECCHPAGGCKDLLAEWKSQPPLGSGRITAPSVFCAPNCDWKGIFLRNQYQSCVFYNHPFYDWTGSTWGHGIGCDGVAHARDSTTSATPRRASIAFPVDQLYTAGDKYLPQHRQFATAYPIFFRRVVQWPTA
nr:hypothetical protein [Pandoravirus massiliensis]